MLRSSAEYIDVEGVFTWGVGWYIHWIESKKNYGVYQGRSGHVLKKRPQVRSENKRAKVSMHYMYVLKWLDEYCWLFSLCGAQPSTTRINLQHCMYGPSRKTGKDALSYVRWSTRFFVCFFFHVDMSKELLWNKMEKKEEKKRIFLKRRKLSLSSFNFNKIK